MMEENRGLMGKKEFSRVTMAGESSIGLSNSKKARMLTESTELLKYCPVGLTGSSSSILNVFNSLDTMMQLL